MIRRPLGAAVHLTYPLRDTTCPFGCGDTLIYTEHGVQCSASRCPAMGGPISRISTSSPYQHGARVQLHGYPGEEAGHRRTGFRGIVTGSLGSTILRGMTDQGQEWAEYWGALDPEDARPRGALHCTCCPRPAPQPRQLELFALEVR